MDTYLAQPWLTLRGQSGTSIVQSEASWLDLGGYREIVAWIDIKEATDPSTTITYQSAPSKDDALFTIATSVGATIGVQTSLMTPDIVTATQLPISRWFRWRVTFPVTSDITFRLWIAANKPGRASLNRQPATPR